MSYKPEVQTAGDGDAWTGNGLAFEKEADALAWADDLMMRWTAVKNTRAVPSDEAPNYQIVDGVVSPIEVIR